MDPLSAAMRSPEMRKRAGGMAKGAERRTIRLSGRPRIRKPEDALFQMALCVPLPPAGAQKLPEAILDDS